MRLRITVDFTRTTKPTEAPATDTEYAPQVDVKHSSILERAEQADFDDIARIGFCRNEGDA